MVFERQNQLIIRWKHNLANTWRRKLEAISKFCYQVNALSILPALSFKFEDIPTHTREREREILASDH